MQERFDDINKRLLEIDNYGLFLFAVRRILDSNCRGLIDTCTETMHSRVVVNEEEAIEIAKDIEVVDELVQIVVDVMVEDLSRKLTDSLLPPPEEKKPSLTLLEGGLKDEEDLNKTD